MVSISLYIIDLYMENFGIPARSPVYQQKVVSVIWRIFFKYTIILLKAKNSYKVTAKIEKFNFMGFILKYL